jgi:hypothetical protein
MKQGTAAPLDGIVRMDVGPAILPSHCRRTAYTHVSSTVICLYLEGVRSFGPGLSVYLETPWAGAATGFEGAVDVKFHANHSGFTIRRRRRQCQILAVVRHGRDAHERRCGI